MSKNKLSYNGGGYINNQENMNYNQQLYASGGQIGSVIQGTMGGAGAGAALGPWGMAAGAVIGGGASYLQNNQGGQQMAQLPAQGLGSQSLSFAGGGDMINFEGASHEQGGIQLSPQVEVEGGETMIDDYIYSDRIKPKGSKKTYADLSKSINDKYKMRTGDKLADDARKKELTTLRDEQEIDPAILKLREKTQAKDFAGGGPTQELLSLLGNYENMIGPGSRNLSGSEISNFALARSGQNQQSSSNNVQGSPSQGNITTGTGGRGSIVNNDSTIPIDPSKSSPAMYAAYKGQGQPQQAQQGPIDFNAGNNFPYTDANTGLVNNAPQGGMRGQNTYEPLPTNQNLGSYIPGALMQSIGPAAQLAGTLIGGPDKTEFDRVNPQYVNPQESINTAERQGALASANMNRSVAQGSRTAGQLMGNTVAGNASIGNNMANTVGGLRQNAANTNVGIYNQANSQNAGIQQQEYIANEQNKASYRQSIYGGLTDLGNNAAGVNRDMRMDNAQELQNNRLLNTLNTAGFNYMVNPDNSLSYIS